MIRSVYTEITNQCNLNCRHCYNASGSNRERMELPAHVLENLFVFMYKNYGVSVFDISGGEPFMHSQWGQVLDVMEKLQDFSFFIVTNGTFREDRFYRLLEQSDRFTVQFSLDGVDEMTHGKIRGAGNFKKTIDNIASLKPKNQPVMKMVLSRYNYDQIEDYFKLAIKYKCKPAFAFVEKMGHADENWLDIELNANEKCTVIEQIDQLKNKYQIKTTTPYALFHCPLSDESKLLNICIKPDGSIQPCQSLYEPQFSMGTIYDLTFDSLKKNVSSIREMLMGRQIADFGCKKCINQPFCSKGCIAAAFHYTGNIMSEDGHCQFRKLQTAKLLLKKAIELKSKKNA